MKSVTLNAQNSLIYYQETCHKSQILGLTLYLILVEKNGKFLEEVKKNNNRLLLRLERTKAHHISTFYDKTCDNGHTLLLVTSF